MNYNIHSDNSNKIKLKAPSQGFSIDRLLCMHGKYNLELLANSLEYPVEDPERIRVDSVFETCVCLFFVCLSANLVTFCTIKYYSAVQYSMVT